MNFNQNRLRFVHCNHLFATVEEIKTYVAKHQHLRPSLYGEPQLFMYGDSTEPNLVLAIGSVGEGKYDFDPATMTVKNKTYYIDFSQAEKDIQTLFEETQRQELDLEGIHQLLANIQTAVGLTENGEYIKDIEDILLRNASSFAEADKVLSVKLQEVEKKLTLTSKETPSLKLDVETTEDGTTIQGDVKLGSMIYEGQVIKNVLIEQEDGIFFNVDVTFDEDASELSLILNGGDVKKIGLPKETHLVSGEYNKEDESLYLTTNLGEEIVIQLGELIHEWAPVDAGTPIILKRECVGYEEAPHYGMEAWQDKLSADVLLSTNENNILRKVARGTEPGEALEVLGIAENIKYVNKDGVKVTVKEALDAAYAKVSEANGNILCTKDNALYANVDLDYDAANNKMALKATNKDGNVVVLKEITLNQVKFWESADYKPATNELELKYIDSKGELRKVTLPLQEILQDFKVINNNKTVELTYTSDGAGPTLSANVNVAEKGINHNILEVRNHELFVDGSASNIAMQNNASGTTVEESIVTIINQFNAYKDAETSARITADSNLSSKTDALKSQILAVESGLTNSIATEVARAKEAESGLASAIATETTARQNADTALQTNINNEVERATSAEGILKASIDTEIERAKAAEGVLTTSLNAEIQERKDAVHNLSDELVDKISGVTNELNGKIGEETTRALSAETALQTQINTINATDIEQEGKLKELQDKVSAISANYTLQVGTTDTLELLKEPNATDNGFVLKGNVKISTANDNILQNVGGALSVPFKVDYIQSQNRLIFNSGTTAVQTIDLGFGELFSSVTLDASTKELVITYTNDLGETKELRVPAAYLKEDLHINNDNSEAIKFVLNEATNTLSAQVQISTDPNNALGIKDNTLFVSKQANSIAYKGTSNVEEALDSIKDALANEVVTREILDGVLQADIQERRDADDALMSAITSVSSTSATNLENVEVSLTEAISEASSTTLSAINAVTTSVGLDANSRGLDPIPSNYISSATTIVEALVELDTQIHNTVTSTTSNIAELDNKIATNHNDITSNTTAITAVSEALDNAITSITTAYTNAISGASSTTEARIDAVNSEVNAIELAVGLHTDGTLHTMAGTYISTATTVVSGLQALDTQAKKNADDIVSASDDIAYVSGVVDTVSTNLTNSADTLTAKIGEVKTSIGAYNEDGSLAEIHGHYTSSAKTIFEAFQVIDTQLFNTATSLAETQNAGNTNADNIELLNNQVSAVSGLAETNKTKIEGLRSDINTVSGTANTNKADIEVLRSDINTVSGTANTNKADIEAISGVTSAATANITALQAEVANHTTAITSLNSIATTNSNNIATLQGVSGDHENRLDTLEASMGSEGTLLNTVIGAIGLNNDGTHIAPSINDLTSGATTIANEIVKLEQAIKDDRTSIATTNTTLAATTAQANANKTNIEGLRSDVDGHVASANTKFTAIENSITSETNNRQTEDNRLEGLINTVSSNTTLLAHNLETSVTEYKALVSAESASRTAEDSALSNRINDLKDQVVSAVTNVQGLVSAEHDRIDTINNNWSSVTNLESAVANTITPKLTELENGVNANKLTVNNSATVTLDKTTNASSGVSLEASVKLSSTDGNLIKANADGIYTKVDVNYDAALNQLTFTANETNKVITLNATSVVKRIYFNPTDSKIYIVYDVNGTEQETSFLASELFKEITANNTNKNVTVEVNTASDGTHEISASIDFASCIDNANTTVTLGKTADGKLNADVKISDREDSLLKKDAANILYVEGVAEYTKINALGLNGTVSPTNVESAHNTLVESVSDIINDVTENTTNVGALTVAVEAIQNMLTEMGEMQIEALEYYPAGTTIQVTNNGVTNDIDLPKYTLYLRYKDNNGNTQYKATSLEHLVEAYQFDTISDGDHNVKFTSICNVDGTISISADVEHYDCGTF